MPLGLDTQGELYLIVLFLRYVSPFLQALKKAIVVELLMGDIPERSLFNKQNMHAELVPYRDIVMVCLQTAAAAAGGGKGAAGVDLVAAVAPCFCFLRVFLFCLLLM